MNIKTALWKKLIGIYKNELNSQGCRVHFRNRPSIKHAEGTYCDKLIEIDKNEPLWSKFLTLVHEGQHFKCDNKKCFCFKRKDDFWAEYHAIKVERLTAIELLPFNAVVKLNYDEAKRWNKNSWISHLKALRRVANLKVFKDLAKKEGKLRKYNKMLKKLDEYLL